MPLYQYREQDRETTFLFIHIPKTGGTAIESYLRNIGINGYFDPPSYMPVRPYLKVPPAHYDYGYLNRLFDLSKLYSFAVVRHPVKRLISEYKWATETTNLPEPLARMDFSAFIRHMFELYRKDENVAAGHYKPQIRFVGEKVSKIFKYEAGLDSIIQRVLQDVGLKMDSRKPIPRLNTSSARQVVPSDSDLELINRVYAEDFAAFGYDPVPAAGVNPS